MFTDGPATPHRVETILDVIRWFGQERVKRSTLIGVVQPRSLPGVTTNSRQGQEALSAAVQLNLLKSDRETVEPSFDVKSNRTSKEILLESFDSVVLSTTEVEKHFALFYAFVLGLGAKVLEMTREQMAAGFQESVYGKERKDNPFNVPKLEGQRRWMRYVGLGWHDSKELFHPNPYGRLLRALPVLFGASEKLEMNEFMERLANTCAELDGGALYRRANRRYERNQRACSMGLSHALIDLHNDEHIRLYGDVDSAGWTVKSADPTPDKKTFNSDRIDYVELVTGRSTSTRATL